MKTAWVCLGANGDILNMLPLVWHDHQIGNRPTVVVSREFAPLLEGICYADILIFDGDYSNVQGAVSLISKQAFDRTFIAQCHGTEYGRQCSNFCEEVYRLVGRHKLWETTPLIFDNRNPSREAELLKSVHRNGKPILLVSTGGNSSPFPYHDVLWSLLQEVEAKYQIVWLNGIKAERLYDLLALYEKAEFLIASDSAPLHLAQATENLKVIALATDSPDEWYGCPRRPNHVAYLRYSEFDLQKREILRPLLNQGISPGKVSIDSYQPSFDIHDPPSFTEQTKWPAALFDFSKSVLPMAPGIDYFNCSLVTHKGSDWLVPRRSRWRPNMQFGFNDIVAFQLEGLTPRKAVPITIDQQEDDEHFEDPRIFRCGDRLMLACNNFVWGKHFTGAHQLLVALTHDWQCEQRIDVPYGNNGPGVLLNTNSEKNWLWFFYEGQLHLIYHTYPHTVVRFSPEFEVEETFRDLPNLLWPWGQPRGGTPPILVGNEYWSFFHSAIDHPRHTRRYFMGAYSFQAKPPFKVLRFSKRPLLAGSSKDRWGSEKPLVIFPCGSIFRDNKWLVSFGVNDLQCGWITIPHEELLPTTQVL